MGSKVAVVTGANSGIGFETAKELAAQGFKVIMVCRNLEKARVSAKVIKESAVANIEIMQADLASFASIKAFAMSYLKNNERLDILINNAGLFSERAEKTEDGFEMTMGVNHLGTYMLTRLLLPVVLQTERARIVNIASKAGFYGNINLSKPFHGPHGFKGYSASKLAQIWFTMNLANELRDKGILVAAVSPGRGATNIWRGNGLLMKIVRPIMLRTAESAAQCAQTGLHVALAPESDITSGFMYENKEHLPYNKRCLDRDAQQILMKLTREVTGI